MSLINKYQEFENLTPMMVNELIDKIVVYERDRKGSTQTTQRIDIYFTFIGAFVPPADPIDPEEAAALEEERRKAEEIKDRRHRNYIRRKANGKQKEYEKKYEARRKARMDEKKAQIEKPCMTIPEYRKFREETRTESDLPEGMIGYDADEVTRKVSAGNMGNAVTA